MVYVLMNLRLSLDWVRILSSLCRHDVSSSGVESPISELISESAVSGTSFEATESITLPLSQQSLSQDFDWSEVAGVCVQISSVEEFR